MDSKNWIVVTDFDGTLTQKDVGNELCQLYSEEKFLDLQKKYRQGVLNLKDYQHQMWTNFPCGEKEFIESSKRVGQLRPGVNEFLETCLNKNIPVYIASCGIEQYINSVVDSFFSKFSQKAIHEINCNKAKFNENSLEILITPESNDPTLPLHKGKWAQALSKKHNSAQVLCIGNGTSDKSFIGYADQVAATDSFYKYCVEIGHGCLKFSNFFDLLKDLKFLH